jgi:secretion/DNA translocation related TadE-like protein
LKKERGSASVIAAALAGLLALLAAALAAGGMVSAGRSRALAASDAAALAAAPVTFRPFGATGSPAEEAEKLAAEHGATLIRCRCTRDPSWSPRVVEVEVALTIEAFGSHTVRAVSRAEFDPVRLLVPDGGTLSPWTTQVLGKGIRARAGGIDARVPLYSPAAWQPTSPRRPRR